ncbi:MAG: DNA primase, partial [Rectinema sp.]|nr:DNA primase [Rectinema sp.]
MMARIASETRQQILDRTDFLSVYQEHVRLTKKGSSYWGLCPFHAEKTPSFSVSADTGLFYCFGCHKGGSVIQFLMDLDKLSYTEVMEELAKRAGIEIHFEQSDAAREIDRERQALLELYERLSHTFNWFLREHASGAPALAVLRRRGIPDTLIDRFNLGYAPSQKQWLYSFLQSKGYSDEFLSRSGLFSRNDPRWPLFSGRIMFPITDAKSRVIAFGGRTMADEGPKYINSPETLLFRKQETLFGLAQALESIKAKDEAIVCEGYMDVLSFHAAGLANAVAPLGTAFTSQQALALKRRASRVILCFDADEAGMKAAERACAIATAAGLETS